MANGDVVVRGLGQLLVKLLDAQPGGTPSDGQWVGCEEYDMGIVTTAGAATTTQVEVDISNDVTIPANNTHGIPLAVAYAAGTGGFLTIASCPRWIKARLLATGTGTVNVIALLRSNAQG